MTATTPADPTPGEAAWPAWKYSWRLFTFRPKRQLINLAGVFFGWGAQLLPGVAAKAIFDRIGGDSLDGDLAWLWWPIALLAAWGLASPITAFTLQATNGGFAFANATRLQRNILRRILSLPGASALARSPGETVSRLRDDTDPVIWYPIVFNNVIGSTVTGGIALAIMWSISPLITAGVFVPVLLVVCIVELARARLIAVRRANQIRTAEVAAFVGDVFAAAPSIQLARANARTVERFRTLNHRRRAAAVRDRMLEEFLHSAFWIVNLGTGLVLIFAGRSLASGDFSVGSLALFVFFLEVFKNFTRDIGEGLAGYQHQRVSFERLHELLDGDDPARLVDDDEIHERASEPLPSPVPALPDHVPLERLEIDRLTCTYVGRAARGVHDISFDVAAGSFTVVVGRVGSGKSTLLKAVLGLLPADGTVRWNGETVCAGEHMVAPHAAYTPQVPRLFSDTLAENVCLGHSGDLAGALRDAALDRDVEAMPEGVDTMLGARGVRLSGGQLQRTAAARMFVREPDLLVCDDLSSALDVETEAQVWDRVASRPGRTVLAVSHRHAALRRADQIIVLVGGCVDAIGTVDELLRDNAEFRHLWQLDASA